MALWDASKADKDRINDIRTNSGDQLPSSIRKALQTEQTTYRNESIPSGRVIQDINRLVAYDDAGNARVVLGFDSGGFGSSDWGFKVSQDGFDVFTADESELSLSSAFNSFKIVGYGTKSVTRNASSTNGQDSITHSLGYTPMVICAVLIGSTRLPVPGIEINVTSGIIDQMFRVQYVTSTQIGFEIVAPSSGSKFSSSQSATFIYWTLREAIP